MNDPLDRAATTELVGRLGRRTGTIVEDTGRGVMDRAQVAGRATILFLDTMGFWRQAGSVSRQLLRQIESAGFGSLLILALIAGLTGMIMAMQTGHALQTYGSVSLLGAIIPITFCRELGPIWAAVIVLARVGASMAAELGTMAVNEEIDALRSMSIDPRRYLVLPRILALLIAMPALTLVANCVGILGGMLVGKAVFSVSTAEFLSEMTRQLTYTDVMSGLFKSTIFGAIIGTIACDQGMNTTDGAEGVGRSTTTSVVLSVLFVLLADLVLTWFVQVVVTPSFSR